MHVGYLYSRYLCRCSVASHLYKTLACHFVPNGLLMYGNRFINTGSGTLIPALRFINTGSGTLIPDYRTLIDHLVRNDMLVFNKDATPQNIQFSSNNDVRG